MANLGGMLRESIEFACGQEGVKQFTEAGYGESAFLKADGNPDLQGLTLALLNVFPPEKASVIAGDFGRRLRAMPASHAMDGSRDEAFAKYFNAPTGEVKGLIIEARRVREAMGKEIVDYGHVELKVDTVDPIDREITGFVHGQNTHSSLDILDFTRYLKSKGYSIQECIVLEKVYEKIEQRKKEEKFALEQRIEVLLSEKRAPNEADILKFIDTLGESGLAWNGQEVRRMIRDAMLRHS